MSDLLPVHGFVLAGGKSSRMGVDKATLPFQGRPMVEIALEKLRGFCADVSIVGDFVRELGIPTVMMGFGLPDDNLHAPNEKFHLANFHRGIESIILFLDKVGVGA